jgi:NAD(P)-dependent dehydrogenase (short-subunit alcohol dehydrogenase family)
MSDTAGQRVILITGCSSGFGALCAREFAHAGDQVVATMRNPAQQTFAADDAIEVRALDVTDADSIRHCVEGVLRDYGHIDVLINNAGIHLLGAMEDMAELEFRRVFETNFFGAINMARAVLPGMRERGQGRIISVSSIGSLVGRVIDGAYCASKAALETALEAMKYEVERFGVQVSVVCPSAFQTQIGHKMVMPKAESAEAPYHELLAFRFDKVREAVAEGEDPQVVASLIRQIASDENPRFRYIVGSKAALMQQTLNGLTDAERQALIRKLAIIDWWVSGDPGPTP